MLEFILFAQTYINIQLHVALAAFAVPLSIGIIGYKACESVGRNPEASTKVLVQSIIAMAFAEAVIFIAIILGNIGAPLGN